MSDSKGEIVKSMKYMLKSPIIRRQVRIAMNIVSCGEKVFVGTDRDSLDACIYYGIKPSQIRYGNEKEGKV